MKYPAIKRHFTERHRHAEQQMKDAELAMAAITELEQKLEETLRKLHEIEEGDAHEGAD